MYKQFYSKLLLLVAMIVAGAGNISAAEVEVASATFNGNNATYTEGWTTTGTGTGRTDCIIIGSGENITSPAFDLSQYTKVTISIKARKYGTLTGSKATIDVAIGENSVGTTDATGTNATTSLEDIEFEPTAKMTAASLVFTCTNATSAGSTHGAGINSIVITGTTSSTDPEISAEDVLLTYDATSGEIAYSVTNPVDGVSLQATTDANWISNINVASDKVTFSTTANEGNADRTGNITLSYTGAQDKVVTVSQGHFALDYVVLPYSWEGGGKEALNAEDGVTTSGLGDNYSNVNAPYLVKFDNDGDYIQFKTDSRPGKVTIGVKMLGGATTSKITIQGSANGTTFTDVEELTISGSKNDILNLETTNAFALTDRYVKLVFTKGSNVGVGPITIEKGSEKAAAEISFAETSYEANIGEAFTAPVLINPNQLEVTYASSNPQVATVDETSGEVTIVAAGQTTITATFSGNDEYEAGKASYTLTVVDPNAPGTANNPYTVEAAIAYINTLGTSSSPTKVYVKGIVSQVDSYNDKYKSITYWISDDGETTTQMEVYSGKGLNSADFASIDDIQVGDEVTVCGTVKLYNQTPEFDYNNYLVSLVRPQASQDPVINAEDVNLTYDATSGEIEFSIENPVESYNVTASADVDWISNVTVAADANKVTFTTTVNEGSEAREGNITINYGETTVVTSKVVKVTQGYNEGTEPVIGNGSFVKVTSTDDITSGNYLIVYETGSKAFDGSLETLDAMNNTIDVTIADDKIAANETTLASVFTLDVTAGTVKSASGNYIGVSSNNNGLKQTDNAATYTHTFSIDTEGNAVLAAVFEGSTMTLRFNNASNQDRFRYYKSGQEAIQLYKLVENFVPTVTIGEAQWATYVAVDNVEFPEGVTAYIPVQVNEGQTAVMIESVNAVKKGEPVILNGEAGTYDLSIAETEPAEVENIFKVSDGTDVSDGTYYMLSYKNEKVGFRKVQDRVTIPAGKPYIVIVNAAKEFIPFGGGEATGIESFETVGFDVNAPIYDMQGRQVQKLQKGIFIQNGKKLIVK